MSYPKLCIQCGTPYQARTVYTKFCSRECGRKWREKHRPKVHKLLHYKIYGAIKAEWEQAETNPTHCYKCGAEIDYWTFDYANRYGRVCKRCASGHKCNISSNKTST